MDSISIILLPIYFIKLTIEYGIMIYVQKYVSTSVSSKGNALLCACILYEAIFRDITGVEITRHYCCIHDLTQCLMEHETHLHGYRYLVTTEWLLAKFIFWMTIYICVTCRVVTHEFAFSSALSLHSVQRVKKLRQCL